VDDGRRAFWHTQQCKLPFTASRTSERRGLARAVPLRRPACALARVSEGLRRASTAVVRRCPMRSLLRLTSDAARESLKCMATQLGNNERKKIVVAASMRTHADTGMNWKTRSSRESTAAAVSRKFCPGVPLTNKARFHRSHSGIADA